LRQLFVNLIGNALEAGATSIRIRVAPGREWNHSARRGTRVVIGDNGSGIPAALLDEVFEPFFTTKEEKGVGLGLWVSKGIVQKHEGGIAVRSSTRPGQSGTVFSLFFPTS
jgi:signal transduction histidine kinase